MVSFSTIFHEDDGTPLYRQLYEYLKYEMIAGNLRAGEKLPSKRALAANARISQSTVETAYGQLAAEGYIRAVPKSGYYVCRLEGAAPAPRRAPAASAVLGAEGPLFRYDFNTNAVDTAHFPFSTWAKLSREALRDENRALLRASHPQGDPALRQSIADYLHEFRGVSALPERIIVGAGTEYLLGLAVQVLGAGAVYAVENPGYGKTRRILAGHGAAARPVGMDGDGLDVARLAATDANVVYVTPSHHFPLGAVMPVSRRLQLLAWAAGDDRRYVIEDDYDSEFRYSGKPIPSLQGMDDEKVIYLGTFSRCLAPSIRVSYLALPPKLMETYLRQFSFYSSTVSGFEQSIIRRFIDNGHFERHLNRMRNLYRARKDALAGAVRARFGGEMDVMGENAGLHLLLRSKRLSEAEMTARAGQGGVRVYGLSGYYMEPVETMIDHTVVLGYAHFTEEEIADAVRILGERWLPISLFEGDVANRRQEESNVPRR